MRTPEQAFEAEGSSATITTFPPQVYEKYKNPPPELRAKHYAIGRQLASSALERHPELLEQATNILTGGSGKKLISPDSHSFDLMFSKIKPILLHPKTLEGNKAFNDDAEKVPEYKELFR